ncbi:like-Sm domain-containing protein [Jackrogersella minutella]|nr:like-Sm domain-containing protein [Jackrogersella minutella]
MSFVPINPRPMLQDLVNKDIVVRLKWGEAEYRGRLVSSDSYMNIQLTNAQEFIDQKFTSDLGQILIRYVSILGRRPEWYLRLDDSPTNNNTLQMQ